MAALTAVKKYASERSMRRGVASMARKGFEVKSPTYVARRRGLIGNLIYWLFFGWAFALLFNIKSGYYQVTFART